jgi:hypothetical protein
MLVKTLNGDSYSPVKGESALAHQLRLASALRSTSARRPNITSTASSPQSSSPSPAPEHKDSPPEVLPLAARDGDSSPRKSDVKIEDKAQEPVKLDDKKVEVKPSD